jgi:6,7-dimethyl-8-ribityllumazine synthase
MSKPPNILIVESRFYPEIADELLGGASGALKAAGATFEVIEVPGAMEIPAAIKFAVSSRGKYDGFVALGCVIRGETAHYDLVCKQCFEGLRSLGLEHSLAIGSGVLTVENHDQALVRAAQDQKNKGADAVRACLKLLELKEQFGLLAD